MKTIDSLLRFLSHNKSMTFLYLLTTYLHLHFPNIVKYAKVSTFKFLMGNS